MVLDVSKAILSPGTQFPFSVAISLPPQDVTGETVSLDDVRLEGAYSAMEGSVWLEGTLHTVAHAACAMCLGPATIPMEFSFREVFKKDVTDDDAEAFRYEGSKLELEPFALTLVMLNLPMRFLCKESCKGSDALKAVLAETSQHASQEETTQRPFEGLRELLTKDEEV